MRKGQLDDDPRLQGIDAHRAGSALKGEGGMYDPARPSAPSSWRRVPLVQRRLCLGEGACHAAKLTSLVRDPFMWRGGRFCIYQSKSA